MCLCYKFAYQDQEIPYSDDKGTVKLKANYGKYNKEKTQQLEASKILFALCATRQSAVRVDDPVLWKTRSRVRRDVIVVVEGR